MGAINFFVDDEDMKAADSSRQFTFDVPADAVVRGNLKDLNDDKARAQWIQKLQIISSKMYEEDVKDRDGNTYDGVVIEIDFQVPPDALRGDGSSDINAGRPKKQWYRLVPAAQKNKNHPKYKANNFNISSLNGIVRSIWGSDALPSGQRVDYGEYFGGEEPAVKGGIIVANIKQNRYDGNLQDQFTDFIPLELQKV